MNTKIYKHIITALTATVINTGIVTIASADNLKTPVEQQSYSAGYMQGETLFRLEKELDIKLDSKTFISGLTDGLKNHKPSLDEKQIKNALVTLQQKIFNQQKKLMEKKLAENEQIGKDFLAKKQKEKGIKKLGKSDILYKINKSGNAKSPSPQSNDTVEVTYTGTHINGQTFDKGSDVKFVLSDVIKGWQEALAHMKPGDNWTIYVPASLAYGAKGTHNILPNSTLIFDIELKKVHPKKKKLASN